MVFKKRGGPWETDPRTRSAHADGRIGWANMPIRSQETLLRWLFDERGEVVGMVQLAPPRYQTVVIPRDRSLLFRFGAPKGSPEGRSMLRNAYRPWFFKKRLEEIEAVGIERDLAGLPMVKIPAEMLKSTASAQQKQQVEQFKKMVKSIRRNEQEGLVFPAAYDQDTKQPLYDFELLGGGGGRQFNIDGTIRRYEERILGTVLADFILVGHQGTGSYSLHTDKTGIFRTALNSICESIAEVLNRQAVPRLFKLNGITPEKLPKIVPSDVDAPDITQLATFMGQMAGLGVNWFPDPTLENFVRTAARLPELDEDAEERRRQMQMRTEATAFANANSEYLMARQQMAAAMMPQPVDPATGQPAAAGGPSPTSSSWAPARSPSASSSSAPTPAGSSATPASPTASNTSSSDSSASRAPSPTPTAPTGPSTM